MTKELTPKDVRKNIDNDCCIYSTYETYHYMMGLDDDIAKELDKSEISAEFGTRLRDVRDVNTDNNTDNKKQ